MWRLAEWSGYSGEKGPGPIVAGLCPELLAVCRRGCRPEPDRPRPPSTHSA